MKSANNTPNETKSRYADPEQQSAYEAGLKRGRLEGMLSYQKHLISQITNEREQISKKLLDQEGGPR